MNTIDRIEEELRWREILELDPPPFISMGKKAFLDVVEDPRVQYLPNAACQYWIFGIPFGESEYCKPLQLRYMDYAGHCVEELKSSAEYGNKEAFYLIQRLHELAAEVAGVR